VGRKGTKVGSKKEQKWGEKEHNLTYGLKKDKLLKLKRKKNGYNNKYERFRSKKKRIDYKSKV